MTNATLTENETPDAGTADVQVASPPSTTSPPEAAPSLESVVEMITTDARFDSVKYLIRSDVGHDGE